ncbi:MAG: hypothetical protein WBD31_12365, partial [Rubripirellula sp.]
MRFVPCRFLVACLVIHFACLQAKADLIGNFDSLEFVTPGVPGNGQFGGASISADISNLYGSSTGFIVFNLTGLNVTGDA